MENAESSQVRRCLDIINQVPHDPSKRRMISLDGGRFIATTIRMIIYILKNMFNGSWTTWTELLYAYAFFQWEVVPVVLVHKVSEASMRNIYPCLMSKARDDSIKMAQPAGVEFDGSDFSVLKPYNPKWIESSYWEDMIDRVWNKRGKLWKHCGGSIAVSLLKRRLIRCLIHYNFLVYIPEIYYVQVK
uniref:Transposase, Ptta/En/Spm n=1 Tax=Tanacetum cinerariifolium TaxID=118510 RepID=A0A6L2JR99_TANCI|nr:transposase, Ptta/En/Spm [Tanacetum cinerariifolium]